MLLPWKFRNERNDALRLLLNKLIDVKACGFFALPRFQRSVGSSIKVSTISDMTAEELARGLESWGLCEYGLFSSSCRSLRRRIQKNTQKAVTMRAKTVVGTTAAAISGPVRGLSLRLDELPAVGLEVTVAVRVTAGSASGTIAG